MALKKVSENSTEKFENAIGESLVMSTTKSTTKSNVTIHSRVKKVADDEEVATVSYDQSQGYLLIDIRKQKELGKDELKAVLGSVSDDIVEELYPADAAESEDVTEE